MLAVSLVDGVEVSSVLAVSLVDGVEVSSVLAVSLVDGVEVFLALVVAGFTVAVVEVCALLTVEGLAVIGVDVSLLVVVEVFSAAGEFCTAPILPFTLLFAVLFNVAGCAVLFSCGRVFCLFGCFFPRFGSEIRTESAIIFPRVLAGLEISLVEVKLTSPVLDVPRLGAISGLLLLFPD